MTKTSLLSLAALALSGFVSLTEAKASILIFDNTGLTSNGSASVGKSTTIFGTFYFRQAQSFTTGAQSYSLDSVSIKIAGNLTAADYTVSLYSNSGTTHPSANVLSFTTADFNNGTPTLTTFAPSTSFTLAANTTYWIVAQANGSSLFTVGLISSAADHFNSEVSISQPFTGSWGPQNNSGISAQVSATAVPEPASFAMIAGLGCASLFMARRRLSA